jgi:hypothetical protein
MYRLDQDPTGIGPAQREIVTLHYVFDRVAQGSNPLHKDGLTSDKSHLQEAAANRSMTANTKDSGPLAWFQMTQRHWFCHIYDVGPFHLDLWLTKSLV